MVELALIAVVAVVLLWVGIIGKVNHVHIEE